MQPLEHMVPLLLEMLLQRDLLPHDVVGLEEREGGELEWVGGAAVEEGTYVDTEEVLVVSIVGRVCEGGGGSEGSPDCDKAVIRFLGPTTQQTRQPGRRQFCPCRTCISKLVPL